MNGSHIYNVAGLRRCFACSFIAPRTSFLLPKNPVSINESAPPMHRATHVRASACIGVASF